MQVRDTILNVLKRATATDNIDESLLVAHDAGLDSLDMVEIAMDLEKEFNLRIDDNEMFFIGTESTVKDFVDYYEKLITEKTTV